MSAVATKAKKEIIKHDRAEGIFTYSWQQLEKVELLSSDETDSDMYSSRNDTDLISVENRIADIIRDHRLNGCFCGTVILGNCNGVKYAVDYSLAIEAHIEMKLSLPVEVKNMTIVEIRDRYFKKNTYARRLSLRDQLLQSCTLAGKQVRDFARDYSLPETFVFSFMSACQGKGATDLLQLSTKTKDQLERRGIAIENQKDPSEYKWGAAVEDAAQIFIETYVVGERSLKGKPGPKPSNFAATLAGTRMPQDRRQQMKRGEASSAYTSNNMAKFFGRHARLLSKTNTKGIATHLKHDINAVRVADWASTGPTSIRANIHNFKELSELLNMIIDDDRKRRGVERWCP